MSNNRKAKRESSELLIIKFLGGGFLGSLGILGAMTFTDHTEQILLWSNLTTFLGGLLAGIITSKLDPRKRLT